MKTNGEGQRPRADGRKQTAGGACLCAEISFDGKLLDPAKGGAAGPVPAWWTRLLARKRSQPADAATARALFDAGRVSELCLRVRPCVDGRPGQPALSGAGNSVPFFTRSISWELLRMATPVDGSCLLHYRRADG